MRKPPLTFRFSPLVFLLCVVAAQAEPPAARYRVEQVFRLETTSAEAQPLPGRLRTEPVRTAVEGRVRFVLERQQGQWHFRAVETEGPRTEPPEKPNAPVERVLALGLAWMNRLEGQEFSGTLSEVPVFPLGEPAPRWLTEWLRWAQTGNFAGVEGSPIGFTGDDGASAPAYHVQWLRSEFRQAPCHVQQARWVTPMQAAASVVPAELAAEGVEARTYFAAQSLEWVSQENPALMYAERSAVRETFWSLEKVKNPQLQELVFRLRLVVQVRVERLP